MLYVCDGDLMYAIERVKHNFNYDLNVSQSE